MSAMIWFGFAEEFSSVGDKILLQTPVYPPFHDLVKNNGRQLVYNEMDLVIFLRDPQNPKSHEPDVNDVVRLCDIYNIPLATNLASAELLIKALDRGDMEWREVVR